MASIKQKYIYFRSASCSQKSDRGLILAAKALALTGLEVMKNPTGIGRNGK